MHGLTSSQLTFDVQAPFLAPRTPYLIFIAATGPILATSAWLLETAAGGGSPLPVWVWRGLCRCL